MGMMFGLHAINFLPISLGITRFSHLGIEWALPIKLNVIMYHTENNIYFLGFFFNFLTTKSTAA